MFLCVILHTMSTGKSLQFLCIFPFSAISMMFVKIMLSVCMLVGMVVRLLLVPFMKQKLITLCIIDPFAV